MQRQNEFIQFLIIEESLSCSYRRDANSDLIKQVHTVGEYLVLLILHTLGKNSISKMGHERVHHLYRSLRKIYRVCNKEKRR